MRRVVVLAEAADDLEEARRFYIEPSTAEIKTAVRRCRNQTGELQNQQYLA